MVVDTLGADLAADSGVAELGAAACRGAAACPSLDSSSVVRPFSASGAGSRPFRMNLQGEEFKKKDQGEKEKRPKKEKEEEGKTSSL
jgi:hypothetical protein